MDIELTATKKEHEPLFSSVENGLAAVLSGRDYPPGQQIKMLKTLRYLLLILQNASDPEKSGHLVATFSDALLNSVSKKHL